MKRLDSILKTVLMFVIPGTVAIATPGEAHAQVIVGVGVDVDAGVVVEPPEAYIATVQPEYYEGRPVYYYNNYWYYRDRWGHWGYYRTEPGWLRGRREYWASRGYEHYRPEYWHQRYDRGGRVRGGYERGGYPRGGYPRGAYVRGGYERRGGAVHGSYAGRYHYRR